MKLQRRSSGRMLTRFQAVMAASILIARVSAAQGIPQPPITWSSPQLLVILSPGEGTSRDVTFVSAQDLPASTIQAVPEIAPFTAFVPSNLPVVSANAVQRVHISFFVPSSQALGTYEGTIHVQVGNRTVPATLKVTVRVWPTASANGVAVHYPPTLEINPQPLALGGPLSLNTFHSAYLEGGIIPVGGAEVDFTRVPLPSQPLPDVIAKELQGTTIESTDAISISGSSGTRISYTASFTPSLVYKNVAVYVPRGAFLYKFYLTYQAGNPLESQLLTTFQEMLTTVQLS